MLEKIKKIRQQTGVGMVDIKKALEEANGNEDKAIEIIRKKGHIKALKKAGREAKEGIVFAYIHSNKKIGTLLELFCETDFVARNEEFVELAKDIAMHISAMDPKFLRPEDVSEDIIAKEKEIWSEQLKKENKTVEIMVKIMEGKEKKFREENSLLGQPFVKNPEITIGELINQKIAKMGENIQVGNFVRYEL